MKKVISLAFAALVTTTGLASAQFDRGFDRRDDRFDRRDDRRDDRFDRRDDRRWRRGPGYGYGIGIPVIPVVPRCRVVETQRYTPSGRIIIDRRRVCR